MRGDQKIQFGSIQTMMTGIIAEIIIIAIVRIISCHNRVPSRPPTLLALPYLPERLIYNVGTFYLSGCSQE